MRLAVIFQSSPLDSVAAPLIQEAGIPPHLVNVYGLASILGAIERAVGRHGVSEVSLTVFLSPSQISPYEVEKQKVEVQISLQLLAGCSIPTKFVNPVLRQIEGGPFSFASQAKADFIYFVEGNSLQDEGSLNDMLREYKLLSGDHTQDIAVTPFDQGGLYNAPQPSQVLAGSHRYWRTVPYCTRTLLMHKKTFLRFAEVFEYDNRIFDKDPSKPGNELAPMLRLIPCFGPLPALGVSLRASELPPFTTQVYSKWFTQAEMRLKQLVTPSKSRRPPDECSTSL